MSLFTNLGDPLSAIAFSIFVLLLAAAATWDVLAYRIPNAIPLGIVVAFLAFAIIAPERADIVDGMVGLAVTLAIGLPLFHWRVVGGGDIKLLTATATWLGFKSLGLFLVLVAIAGAWWAILLVACRLGFLANSWLKGGVMSENIPRILRWGSPLPYAVAIGIGSVLAATRLTPFPWLA